MSRLISTETPGTIRTKLLKLIYFTSAELINQNELNNESKDMAAFIVLSLTKISKIVDQTVKAWEARNFWLKSDLFQKEWAWVSECRKEFEQALKENDWSSIKSVGNAVFLKTNLSSIGTRFSQTEPWKGAWAELQARQIKKSQQ